MQFKKMKKRMQILKKVLMILLVALLLLLTSCKTTKEVSLVLPEFPQLDDINKIQEEELVVIVNKDYWIKLIKYVADCEKTFELLEMFDMNVIIE